MPATPAGSIRARVRAEMIEEIKATARRHLATDGANLSLRAVARDLGVVSSALYRYFPSRDDLLTALIVDAYNSLGEATERADAAVTAADPDDLYARWISVCSAIRDWARAHPPEYALIYGSPVPGYVAPEDTLGPASRPTNVLGDLLRHGVASGVLPTGASGEALSRAVRLEFERISAAVFDGVPGLVLARGFTAWIQLFGFISFELFGRFTNVVDDLDGYFEHQLRTMAGLIGIPVPAREPG